MRAKSNKRFQRGAIGILGAITLLLMVIFFALVVDSTRLWMVKRQLQTVADISAIEAAKGLGGCNPTLNDVMTRASQAALANGFTESLANAPNMVETGSVSTIAGRRHWTTDGSAQAVHVKVTKKVPASLIASGLFGNDVTLSAEAVSLPNASIASFSVGTTALSLNTQDSVILNGLLGGMLGTPIDLKLVSYEGLASTDITLADLIKVEGSALTVDELLTTQFSPGELLTLISDAVKLPDNLAPELVNEALSELVVPTIHNTQISLGELLNVNQNSQAEALNAKLNVLNLINMIASVSNGQNAVDIPLAIKLPNLPGLPDLLNVTTRVQVIEPAQTAIGPPAVENGEICTFAKTAQVRINLAAVVEVTPLGLLPLAKVNLALNVQAANGSAGLRSIEGNNTTTDIAFETITSLVTTSGVATISVLGLDIPIALNVSPLSSTASNTIMQIERPIKNTIPLTSTVNSALSDTFEQLTLIAPPQPGGLLNVVSTVVNNIVSDLLTPILTSISKLILDPLLKVLGISIANMDVTVDDVKLNNSGSLVM